MAVIVDRAQHRLGRMRQSVLTAAGFLEAREGRGIMVTLTYAPSAAWARCQIALFLKNVREWCRARSVRFRYVWVMELTKLGRPHYHVLIWLPRGLTLPKPDKRGWWPHGMTKIEWARNAIAYLVKYVSKGSLLQRFPKGARICGCGGLDATQRQKKSWSLMPAWVRNLWPAEDRPTRAKGGGFVNRETGEWQPSPWAVVLFGPRWVWTELERVSVLVERRLQRIKTLGVAVSECSPGRGSRFSGGASCSGGCGACEAGGIGGTCGARGGGISDLKPGLLSTP